MANLEKESFKRTRNRNIQKNILTAIGTAGFLSIAFMAPNALQALEKFSLIPSGRRQGEIIKRSFYRLRKRGLLEFEQGHIALTPLGKAELLKIQMHELGSKPKKWDKKWRILLFDIPEKNKSIRQKLRKILRDAHFYRLQDSAWLYPYDCEDFVALIKAKLKPGRDVLYIIADAIENDKHLRAHFSLPSK